MVLGQPIDHGVQGHQSGCGQNPCLPHAPAHHLPPSFGFADEFFGADEHRTHRATQRFRQTEAGVINVASQLRNWDLKGYCGIEYARPVQMYRHAGLVGHVADSFGLSGSHHHAAAPVLSVLQADYLGCGNVGVAGRPDVPGHVSGIDSTGRVLGNQSGLHAGQGGLTSAFVPEHVGLVAHDDLVAVVAVGQCGQEVAHGAAGGK